jgi:drug/metabolite transporter (DMT)-like permease
MALEAKVGAGIYALQSKESPVLSQRSKADFLLVVTTFFWGATFVIVKGALADAAPFPFLAARFTLAGLLMWLFLARGRVERQVIWPSVVLGIFLFAGYAFQTWGLIFTTPSKSAFITGFSVILVPLILLLGGQRIRAASLIGAVLGLSGLYILVVPSGLHGVNRGDILTLLGAISYAGHIILVGHYTRQFSFLQLAPGQILVVGAIATLAGPLGPAWVVHWTARLLFAIVVTAVFATAFAFACQVWAQQYTPPSHTALIFALEPVFAALTSRIVAGERLGRMALFGSALILAGMVVSELWGGAAPVNVEG